MDRIIGCDDGNPSRYCPNTQCSSLALSVIHRDRKKTGIKHLTSTVCGCVCVWLCVCLWNGGSRGERMKEGMKGRIKSAEEKPRNTGTEGNAVVDCKSSFFYQMFLFTDSMEVEETG